MPGESTGETSRKEQILEAAFTISKREISWSMQDIAREVGVSKPALYRHYANRAELEQKMEERVMEHIFTAIKSSDNSRENIRMAVVGALRDQPDYYMFLTKQLITVDSFAERALKYLIDSSPRISGYFSRINNAPADEYHKQSLGIQKNAITVLLASYNCMSIREYQNELLRRNAEGFPEFRLPEENRLDELDRIPVSFDDNSSSKLFDAIARAVQAQGIASVTVEKIAEEMGTAKSSLYFYYENKQAMLTELISYESDTILGLLKRHVRQGETFEEQLYLAMTAHARYLLRKPGVITVFNWIRYEMITNHHDVTHPDTQKSDILDSFTTSQFKTSCPNVQLGILSIIKWVLILSSGCTIREYEKGMDKETIMQSIRTMYKLILFGDKELL